MKTKLVVSSVCDFNFSLLEKTKTVTALFERWGYDYRPFVDVLWRGWPSKVEYYTGYVKTLLGEATHVLFIDSSDVVPLCGPDELLERWSEFNHPWVYNAEHNVWPPNAYAREDFPLSLDTYNRHLNGGCYLGEVEHIAKWYAEWTQTPIVCKKSDQEWMSVRYAQHWPECIMLDDQTDLFICMCANDWNVTVTPGHMHNNMTNTDPALIHFNGGTNIHDDDRKELWECLLD